MSNSWPSVVMKTGDWILLEVPDIAAGQGWVSADLIRTSDPIVDLPVVEAGATMEPSSDQ